MVRVMQVMGNMNSGGVEAVIMNYYRNIDRDKVQFDFVVNKNSKIPQKEEILSLGGNIYYVTGYKNIFKYMLEIRKIIKENKYTIVHSNVNTLSVFPLFMAWICRVPVRICHNHSTAGKGEFLRNTLKYFLRPFNRLFANKYFACGEYAGRWMFGNRNFDKGRVKVINNAIDLDKFVYNLEIRNKMRKKLGISDNLVVGHIGRFNKQKNHEYIIKIFSEVLKKNDKAILLLVGEGELQDGIKKMVVDIGIEDKVKFLGVRSDANCIFQVMDVFILPSLYEGLPVVGVEAQAAGLSCVFSNRMTKLVKVIDNVKFLDLDYDVDKWSNTILESARIDRKNTRDEMKKAGFDIKCESKKLEKFYLGK